MGLKTIRVSGFPMDANASDAKIFLEDIAGEGTIYALKFRPSKVRKTRSKAFVMVQFLTIERAEFIANEVRKGLRYHGSKLMVWNVEYDIVPNPRIAMFDLEDTILYCGCLIEPKKMSVLWSNSNVKVEFGHKLKRICFFLTCEDKSYKLELSYESIWEFQLHRSSWLLNKFFVIQVQAAPRIYKMPPRNLVLSDEESLLDYYMDGSNDQWVRTTDFTPSQGIGQSFALCLEIPRYKTLPKIQDYFVHYKEVKGKFELEKGLSYSRNLELVPIVEPQHDVEIPYKILFKVNLMVQNGTLIGPTLDDNFFGYVNPRLHPIKYIECALEHMSHLKKSCFDPANWLHLQYKKYKAARRLIHSPAITLDNGLVYVHRAQVTPCKIYFYGPEINVSNRVLRHFSEDIDNFIRLSFVDEDGEKLHSTYLSPRSSEKRTKIYYRILSVLRNGITIGDKKFEFLAFSSSQLRESSTWMFASRPGLTAADIRKWMGDFSKIRNVAKYATRLGQSLSSSTETLTVRKDEIELIPDIRNSSGHYIFSDGIGKISLVFARRVAKKCGLISSTPSAFQIRYGGYKGVVAVDPTSSKKLSLRKSMSKFESENITLDILAHSKYQPCYLNRQVITLLSTLGVKDRVFITKQEEAVKELDEILINPLKAVEAIEMMHAGEITNVMKEMLLCDYMPNSEPFLSMLLQAFRDLKLWELRTKSRILIQKGRSLMGCLDETRTLKYGEVFVQVSQGGYSGCSSNTHVVTGRVIVAKNPCLHPGDIRVLVAVDVPGLDHMVDCVVFPQKGKRPHPDECSGSDLDGDIYFVSWDPALIPPRQVPPMEYDAAPAEPLNRDVIIQDIQTYFTDYIVSYCLGIISNAHTVFADREPLKAESDPCLKLAELFSIAVDFPKTGVPAEIPQELYVKEYPDFMEKLDKETYESKGVIGKLFRAIKDRSSPSSHIKSFTFELALLSYDSDMEVEGYKDYIDDALFYKEQYDFKLGNLMEQYGIKNEAEILTGSVRKSKMYNKYKEGEQVNMVVRALRKEARGWFEQNKNEDDMDAKASAWYHVTYHYAYFDMYNVDLERPYFLSFPWCVYDKLIVIKRRKMEMRKAATLEQMMKNVRLS